MNNYLVLSIAFSLVTTSAFPLPDTRKGNPLLKYGIQTNSIGAPIFQDHENPKMIYVGPASERNIVGLFNLTDGAIECRDLSNIRHSTYEYPAKEDIDKVINSGRGYAPAFDSNIGVYLRNAKVIYRILDLKQEAAEYKVEFADIYGEYIASKSSNEDDATAYQDAEAKINMRQDKYYRDQILLDSTELESLNGLKLEYKEDMKILIEKSRRAEERYNQSKLRYQMALKNWAPYKDRLSELIEIEDSLQASFNSLQLLANGALERSELIIRQLETRVIGIGSVGIGVYGKELNLLEAALAEKKLDFQVSSLPVFDVALFSGAFSSKNGAEITGNDTSGYNYKVKTAGVPSNTKIIVGSQKMTDIHFTDMARDTPVSILMGDYISTPRSLSFPVTLGAYCGYGNYEKYELFFDDDEDEGISDLHFESVVYKFPAPNSKVVTESAVLKYNYYAKAEPISGNCNLDIDKMDSFWRSKNSSHKWTLFGGSKSKKWDDTRRTYKEDMGLSCSLTKRPLGANPTDAKNANDALEKAIYGDMFAMFTMSYAKNYEITQGEPIDNAETHPLENAGTAVFSLCGQSNIYCAVSAISLKTIDELGGARYSGSTSSSVESYGTITRSFDIDSYIILQGESNLLLRVCIDENVCS